MTVWDVARGWLVVALVGALVVVPAILFWVLLWLAWRKKKEAGQSGGQGHG